MLYAFQSLGHRAALRRRLDYLPDGSVASQPIDKSFKQSLCVAKLAKLLLASSLTPAESFTHEVGSIVGRFEMTDDGLQSLRAFRARLNEQLMKLPEYRAIAVIDRTIQEITEIYGVSVTETERSVPALVKPAGTPVSRLPEARPMSETAQNRIAIAIAEAIESNVSQLRTQRLPQATPYSLVSAAS